ncbi:hypothetical protein LSAT2_019575 [Lamellibrachia satsuma]|nr:hypothetical protein LSAT2_019575 [Lamellibrachia satsuma]
MGFGMLEAAHALNPFPNSSGVWMLRMQTSDVDYVNLNNMAGTDELSGDASSDEFSDVAGSDELNGDVGSDELNDNAGSDKRSDELSDVADSDKRSDELSDGAGSDYASSDELRDDAGSDEPSEYTGYGFRVVTLYNDDAVLVQVRQLRTPYNLLITSLAGADFAVGMIAQRGFVSYSIEQLNLVYRLIYSKEKVVSDVKVFVEVETLLSYRLIHDEDNLFGCVSSTGCRVDNR